MKSEARETQVPMLADKPASEYEEVIRAASDLIEAAKDDRLVSVVCKHSESGEDHAILCIMLHDEEAGTYSYTPAAKLYHGLNMEWSEYVPPAVAMPPRDPNDS